MMDADTCRVQGPVEEDEEDPDLPGSFTQDYNFGGGEAQAPEGAAADGQPPMRKSKQEVPHLRITGAMKLLCRTGTAAEATAECTGAAGAAWRGLCWQEECGDACHACQH